ncbi:MAG TPA: nuclear transport factor 2 family protein, partial [Thermoanaerobaculia bacterium]|nr:nuclear transport factor 2 family protein [Thermoanaerobaculia bacterium]
MRKLMLLSMLLLAAAPLFAQGPSAGAEEAAVRAAIEHYMRGHATGDGSHHRKVFHPEAKLFFMRDGKFSQRTSEEYIAGHKGTPAADEAQRQRRIDWIDVTGDAAVAKLTLTYPEVTFTDYMSLLKIDGEWRIVNKTFHADR